MTMIVLLDLSGRASVTIPESLAETPSAGRARLGSVEIHLEWMTAVAR